MVKRDILPRGRFVARAAILPKLTRVRVLCRVTREAIIRGALEYIVDMTGLAINGEM